MVDFALAFFLEVMFVELFGVSARVKASSLVDHHDVAMANLVLCVLRPCRIKLCVELLIIFVARQSARKIILVLHLLIFLARFLRVQQIVVSGDLLGCRGVLALATSRLAEVDGWHDLNALNSQLLHLLFLLPLFLIVVLVQLVVKRFAYHASHAALLCHALHAFPPHTTLVLLFFDGELLEQALDGTLQFLDL